MRTVRKVPIVMPLPCEAACQCKEDADSCAMARACWCEEDAGNHANARQSIALLDRMARLVWRPKSTTFGKKALRKGGSSG